MNNIIWVDFNQSTLKKISNSNRIDEKYSDNLNIINIKKFIASQLVALRDFY